MELFDISTAYVIIWNKTVFTITSAYFPDFKNTPTASLQKGMNPQQVSWIYDTNQSDGDVSVMLELWGMWSTPLLPSLPESRWPGVVAPDRAYL